MGLLFKKAFHQGLIDGSITLTFRRWERAQVKPGGRYRCHPIGVLEVDAIDTVPLADITDADARASGFPSRAELVEAVGAGDGPLFRVKLRHIGDADARPEAFAAELTREQVADISAKLEKLDRASPVGPWTRKALKLIAKHPHRRAGDLADLCRREKLEFKEDVRKLKRLGLTISHEVGYSLSPRGEAFLSKEKKKR